MKILITGGTGFAGTNLASRLVEHGFVFQFPDIEKTLRNIVGQ